MKYLAKKIVNSVTLSQPTKNTLWMTSEKIASAFSFIAVTSYVYKYIGPEAAGHLSLFFSVYQIIIAVSKWGGDSLIFKKASRNSLTAIKLLHATRLFRVTVFCILSLPVECYFYHSLNLEMFTLSFAVAISSFIASTDGYTVLFNAMLKSKHNVTANVVGLLVSIIFRYGVVAFTLKAGYLSLPIIFSSAIIYGLKARKMKDHFSKKDIFGRIKKRRRYVRYLINSGWGIMLSSLWIVLYTQAQSIVIYYELGSYELGIYSAALTLGTASGFFINSLITSNFVSIFAEGSFIATFKTAKLLRLVFCISICSYVFIYLFGSALIALLYGDKFQQVNDIIFLVALSAIPSFMGTISYRYIIKKSGYSYLALKSFIVCIISLPLMWLLALSFGLKGVVISNLIIEILSLTILNYAFNKKDVMKLHLVAMKVRAL
ncbi:TPA: oligosaccharide flippase family protein [Klebsiella quasipneumoniae subsp. quasipneumoniae]|uniref:oligosaccharide flippase family protein n=1 Tax=Klebsiella pneumoniae complex TaxID=3390273 RepID=UPI0029D815F1|nr:oligosaccharide flippase family protein [Klebsiella pneumoniae]MDX7116435.1 oligosaccharide flippase family protein [Klebsiella pneumoniae]